MGQFVTRDAKIDIKKHCFSLHLSQNRRMADERKWASVSSGKVTFVVWPRSGWRGVQKQQGVVQPHSKIVPAPLCHVRFQVSFLFTNICCTASHVTGPVLFLLL